MKYFITGATGYIGQQLTEQLVAGGHEVHALYRSEKKTGGLPKEGVHLFKGDLLDPDSLKKAVKGTDAVFHVAAFAKPWAKDDQTFYRLNVDGALNVFHAALEAGVSKIVFTSTAGVISPSKDGVPSDETTPRWVEHFTHYERSKAKAEKEVQKLVSKEGLEIITVNPTRVYGPGLLSDSNGVTRMVKMYLEGKFRLIPGDGSSIGNYVYIDDVVEGHLKAMEKGRPGERYILGGDNASFNEFFQLLAQVTGKEQRLFKIPIPVINFAARLMEIRADLTNKDPLLTPPWVRKYLYNWQLSTEKAERELGYQPTPLPEGLRKTVEWLVGVGSRE
ncbi:MAG: hypothetical protein CMN32_13135 [Saprospirales bacterium]|nr:hypothetical protein [Saprospirales bacterium]